MCFTPNYELKKIRFLKKSEACASLQKHKILFHKGEAYVMSHPQLQA